MVQQTTQKDTQSPSSVAHRYAKCAELHLAMLLQDALGQVEVADRLARAADQYPAPRRSPGQTYIFLAKKKAEVARVRPASTHAAGPNKPEPRATYCE